MTQLADNFLPTIASPARTAAGSAAGEAEQLRAEVTRLNAESDSLVRQVLQNFEELSLLRTMAEHLELRESSENAFHLAEHTLTGLREAIDAEGLILATNVDGSFADAEGAKIACRWFGRQVLSDEQSRELIQRGRARAAEGPLVKNRFFNWSEPTAIPQLHSFILVEIRGQGRLCGWLSACNRTADDSHTQASTKGGFSSAEAMLLSTAASMLAAHFHNVDLLRQKERLFTDMVRALVNAIDARDPYTCGHSERVGSYARRLGREIGLPPAECDRVYLAGLLHDVGKISIPDAVLGKPGRLDDEEYGTIQTHPEAGWAILQELAALRHLLPGVLHHHERFDGRGYPDGLAGQEIPIDGRILAICDSYDAMTSDRPYRQGMLQEEAESRLRAGAGSQWDPQLIASFLTVMPEAIAIRHGHTPRVRVDRVRRTS